MAEHILGDGGKGPVETPNLGGRKETLRDTTRTAEIAEIKVKIWHSQFHATRAQAKRHCKMHLFRHDFRGGWVLLS